MLPPSRVLAAELAVNGQTLRRAMAELAESGLLEVRPRRRARVGPGGTAQARELLQRLHRCRSLRQIAILTSSPYAIFDPDPMTYWAVVFRVLKEEAARQGLETSVLRWLPSSQIEQIRSLSGQSGVVAVALDVTYEYLPGLLEASVCHIPLVLYNRWVPWLRLPTVLRDDYAAAERVGRLLYDLGHRNMCMFSSVSLNPLRGRDRTDGWVDFLREAELFSNCTPALASFRFFQEQGAFLRRLFDGPQAPTALVFAYPYELELFFELARIGPGDIPSRFSIVTFDDMAPLKISGSRIPLTSVSADLRRMAQCVIELARSVQAGEPNPPSIRVPCDLHVTDSVGPPRS